MSPVIPLGREVNSCLSVPAIYDSHVNTPTYLGKKTNWQVEYKFPYLLFTPTHVSTFTENHTFMYNLIYRDSVIVEGKCWSFKWVLSSHCAVGYI